MDQFVVACIVDSINNPYFAHTTLGAPGEFPHVQTQGVVLAASLHSDCVYMAGVNLSIGSGASWHIFLLLVGGLSLAPSLAALVPVVPKDAYGLVAAEKS